MASLFIVPVFYVIDDIIQSLLFDKPLKATRCAILPQNGLELGLGRIGRLSAKGFFEPNNLHILS
jgi:hypothetical protein